MSVSIYFAKASKKRNSTYQASFSSSFDCVLKESTSLDTPTFILQADNFDYNLAKWGDVYYFVDNIVSVKNNIWEVTCVVDVLATFKSYILASTQYVCYSSHKSSDWLVDSRIPSLTQSHVSPTASTFEIFSKSGTYILSVNGKNGCELFIMTETKLKNLLQNISTWRSDAETEFLNGLTAPDGDIVVATENLYTVLARSGAFGNAYAEAPNCIRSCIWIPFKPSIFTVTSSNKEIYLGQFATGVCADAISSEPYVNYKNITIPWHFSDWRRTTNEQLYLYLPLVGVVELKTNNMSHATQIEVKYSVTPTDGCLAYEVGVGSEIVGTYGASCSANYPIGISQQASAGDIANAFISGAEKTVSMAVNSSMSPISAGASLGGVALEAVVSAYNVEKTTFSNNNTCIGGIGGGAGAGLDITTILFDIYHDTVVAPSTMVSTMGYPTMCNMTLSSLSGFCQCANAHVSAPAQAFELNAIDAYLNSGFYIE